jgi:hypothetical protein
MLDCNQETQIRIRPRCFTMSILNIVFCWPVPTYHYGAVLDCRFIDRKTQKREVFDCLLCRTDTLFLLGTFQLSTMVVCWEILAETCMIRNGRYFDVLLCIYRVTRFGWDQSTYHYGGNVVSINPFIGKYVWYWILIVRYSIYTMNHSQNTSGPPLFRISLHYKNFPTSGP